MMNTCPIFKQCGGCRYPADHYAAELQTKHKLAEKLLSAFGTVSPIVGADQPCHYRNKVHQVFFRGENAQLASGYYAAGSHRVYATKECLLDNQTAQKVIATVRKLAVSLKLSVFDERRGTGFLRHVMVRRGFHSGEIMVILVTADDTFHGKAAFICELRREHPEICSILQNINSRHTTQVLGPKFIPLYGPAFICDTLCGLQFRLSPSAFYQINTAQTERLYACALDLAGLSGKETVIDAYCGIGTIGLCAASRAGQIIGIELNASAVKDAAVNARLNNITNARFIAGDAGECMVSMAAAGQHADVVFMDPTRSGSTEAFLSACVRLAPEKIVYISCNPATQARDLQYLTGQGYAVRAICPFDLFPHTEHVETVVLMSRK